MGKKEEEREDQLAEEHDYSTFDWNQALEDERNSDD